MNDIEKKALALLNEVWADRGRNVTLDRFSRDSFAISEALCRAIERHEAFRQEVSDVVSGFFADDGFDRTGLLWRFIIAEPVDPLVEAIEEIEAWPPTPDQLVAALAKHGGKIVWENSDA